MSIETITISPTVDTAIYASGDLIGAKLTLSTDLLGKGNYKSMLEKVVVTDKGNQKASFDLILFNADPSATTFTDNAAFAIHANDMDKVTDIIPIVTADYVSISTTFAIALKKDYRLPLNNTTGSGIMYAAIVSRGTPTYAASTNLKIYLTVCK